MKIMNMGKKLSDLFPKRKFGKWENVPSSFGNVFYGKDGAVYNRGDAFSVDDKRLPFILGSAPVIGELIPRSSWGSSLANLLTKTSWDKLRHPIIEKHSNSCQACGTKKNTLDVHEVWNYEFLSDDNDKPLNWGIQHLEGLVCVCKECHEMFHLGLAYSNNRLDEVMERLRAINGWTPTAAQKYCNEVFDRWDEASKIHWILDLSEISHPDGGLTIAKKWEINDNGFLIANTGRITSKTMITNIDWKFYGEKEWRGAAIYKPTITPSTPKNKGKKVPEPLDI
ncbi:hypothetical protein [Aeromonas media]|uniref:hypothetical protein n=1 Tax=Aeromonas media TaxID=651 RepID=UPI003D196A9A